MTDTIIPEKYDALESEMTDREERYRFEQYMLDLDRSRELWCNQCENWKNIGGHKLCTATDCSVLDVGGCAEFVVR